MSPTSSPVPAASTSSAYSSRPPPPTPSGTTPRPSSSSSPRHHPYRPLLDRLGFVPTGADRTRAYWPWDHPDELAFLGDDERSRIHITEGDGDMI